VDVALRLLALDASLYFAPETRWVRVGVGVRVWVCVGVGVGVWMCGCGAETAGLGRVFEVCS